MAYRHVNHIFYLAFVVLTRSVFIFHSFEVGIADAISSFK